MDKWKYLFKTEIVRKKLSQVLWSNDFYARNQSKFQPNDKNDTYSIGDIWAFMKSEQQSKIKNAFHNEPIKLSQKGDGVDSSSSIELTSCQDLSG